MDSKIRQLSLTDLESAFSLETSSFPSDEAASHSSLSYRLTNAPHLFLGSFDSKNEEELIGMICATATKSDVLTHASMGAHVPEGQYLAVHSVCVKQTRRGKGIALALLKEFLRRGRESEGVKGVRLITHDELIPLYEKAGFVSRGKSEVVHGEREWYEMAVDYASYEEGLRWKEGDSNDQKFYCPREGCRSIILRSGVATYRRARESDIDLPPLPAFITEKLPSSSENIPSPPPNPKAYWSIPTPLSFENIGFSKSTPGSTIKYLVCADCDHGPLGWHDAAGRDLGKELEKSKGEFLIDVDRVRYV